MEFCGPWKSYKRKNYYTVFLGRSRTAGSSQWWASERILEISDRMRASVPVA